MKRISIFLIVLSFISCVLFNCIFSYPILSDYTNLTSKEIFDINNYNESEIYPIQDNKVQILSLGWNNIHFIFECNKDYELILLNENISISIVRTGGVNHADIEPASNKDALSLIEIFKHDLQTKCYPVLLKINDNTFLPASLSNYAHGYQSLNITNGHFCLHFNNSTTHSTKLTDKTHQNCVELATKKGEKYLNSEFS